MELCSRIVIDTAIIEPVTILCIMRTVGISGHHKVTYKISRIKIRFTNNLEIITILICCIIIIYYVYLIIRLRSAEEHGVPTANIRAVIFDRRSSNIIIMI